MTTLPQATPTRAPRSAMVYPATHTPTGHLTAQGALTSASSGINLTGADVLRVLRANVWLIVCILAASAIGGFFLNRYLAAHFCRYKAYGLVEVFGNDEIPMPGKPTVAINPAEIELVQKTQAQTLLHEGNFLDAISRADNPIRGTAWFAKFTQSDPAHPGNTVTRIDEAKIDLADNLTAVPIANSRLLEVSMTCAVPDDAKVILTALVDHHIETLRKRQDDIEGKKIDLLNKQLNHLNDELTNEVQTKMNAMERDLGGNSVNTFQNWNGLKEQLSRLLEHEMLIVSEKAGYESRREKIDFEVERGLTPPEVEEHLKEVGLYNLCKEQSLKLDSQIQSVKSLSGSQNSQLDQLRNMKQFWDSKATEELETWRSTLTEGLKASLDGEIRASDANLKQIEDFIAKTQDKLGELNKKMDEYRALQKREVNLRDKIDKVQEEVNDLDRFSVGSPWAAANWNAKPVTPDRPYFPKLAFTLSGALAVGLLLSLGIAFLREMTDTTVRTDRDIAKVGQLNLLGMIQHEADDPQSAKVRLPLAIFDAPHSVVAEQFRQMRTKLLHTAALDTTRSILVTSPSPGDGKSTVACNIAAGLALNGRRILLVDANFRKPTLATIFALANTIGFSDLLGDISLFDTAVADTEIPNLAVLASGDRPANTTELLESPAFIDFVERALESYDHVIFDSGPLLVLSETAAMAPRVDGVISVVRARGNSRGLLVRMRDELRKLRAEHLGVVLNAVRSQGGGYYGTNIKAYYAYQQ